MTAARWNNRHGLVNSFVVALILFLVAFGIIFFWMYRAGIIIDDDANMNLCRASLAVQRVTQINLGILDLDSPLASSCKRRVITITADSISSRSQGTFSVSRPVAVYAPTQSGGLVRTTTIAETNEAVLNSFVAESMRRCWQMGLDGSMQVFNSESLLDQTICVVCDQVSVSRRDPAKNTGALPLAGLEAYLANTAVPALRKGELQQTYATYLDLTGPGATDTYPYSRDCYEELSISLEPTIRDGTYATVLVRRIGDLTSGGWFGKGGCAATVFVPASRLRLMCDYVAN